MEQKVLFAWMGKTDLKASQGELGDGLGPIGQAAKKKNYSHIVLLSNYKKDEEKQFIDWLKKITSSVILKYHKDLSSPTEFGEIYEAVIYAINDIKKKLGEKDIHSTYHISPGTPAMAAVWILLSKTLHPAEIIESSVERGVKTVSLPFDISADYVPNILKPADDIVFKFTQGFSPELLIFSNEWTKWVRN